MSVHPEQRSQFLTAILLIVHAGVKAEMEELAQERARPRLPELAE